MLRLLGRVRIDDGELRRRLVETGLASSNAEVRDAAVQAAEQWADPSLASLLRSHKEPVDWLADYVQVVARDLEG